MTIIQPDYNRKNSRIMTGFFATILIIVLGWGILLYNALVNLNHNIRLLEIKIRDTEVVNAELENKLYELFNPSVLEEVARKRGLLKDRGAKYLETAAAIVSD